MTNRYFAEETAPRWFCMVVKRQAKDHAEARAFFRGENMFAFYPSDMRARRNRHGKPTEREVPIVPGYVFAQTLRRPLWHLLHDLPWYHDVFKIGATPYEFSYVQIRHMQGLTVDARKLEAANAALRAKMAEATRPVAGQPAKITAGPFAGNVVDIEAADDRYAVFRIMGARVKMERGGLVRIAHNID